jgi:hypothetical protein
MSGVCSTNGGGEDTNGAEHFGLNISLEKHMVELSFNGKSNIKLCLFKGVDYIVHRTWSYEVFFEHFFFSLSY